MMKTSPRMINRIGSIIKDEGPKGMTLLKNVLTLLSMGYTGAVRTRTVFYKNGVSRSFRLPCMVISVGNLTLGGTGKTPMTLYLAEMLMDFGYRAVVLTRGYGGDAGKKGGVVSDGRHLFMGPAAAGDEPVMMARALPDVPVIVGRDRYAAGRKALKRFAPDVLILDDGFQHLRLFRDLDLVLLDGRKPFGNTRLFPRGTLREPASALTRADACIYTRWTSSCRIDRSTLPSGMPVFTARHIPKRYRFDSATATLQRPHIPDPLKPVAGGIIQNQKVYAFSGIAGNREFRHSVEDLYGEMTGHRSFPDHYSYAGGEVRDIFRQAVASGAEMVVTTEKDCARLGPRLTGPLPVAVIGIKISFGEDRERFRRFIKSRLTNYRHRNPGG